MDQYIEEKTPKEFTLKIIVKKGSFLVFDQKGAAVYSDPEGLKVLHRIPHLVFLGRSFAIRNRRVSDFTLCKVSKKKTVIPFFIAGERDMRYLLLDSEEAIDMMPVKIQLISSISGVVREADPNARPDLFIVDKEVTGNDIILIKNRVPGVHVILAEDVIRAGISSSKDITSDTRVEDRAVDEVKEVNLNMMSQNPVFLARVHLRTMDLSKVKQLLLDFDMSAPDSGFIHTFIVSMLKKAETDESIRAQKPRLVELADDFSFYTSIMDRKDDEINAAIEKITDPRTFSSYMTLIAKARSMFDNQNDIFMITEVENRLLEKKELMKE